MQNEIERRTVALLRQDSRLTVPLSRLYHALAAEAGHGTGGPGQLRERLRLRPDLFRLIEPDPPWDLDAWPEHARNEYRTALAEAGLAPEVRVALAAPLAPEPAEATPLAAFLRRLDATLVDLYRTAAADDPDGRARCAEAAAQLEELRAVIARGTDLSD